MSVKLMAQAWDTDCPGGALAKLVLVKLADNCNDQGECWPSIKYLARKCQMGERTVFRHLADLDEAGLIRRESKPGKVTSYLVLTPLPTRQGSNDPGKGSDPCQPGRGQKGQTRCNAAGVPLPTRQGRGAGAAGVPLPTRQGRGAGAAGVKPPPILDGTVKEPSMEPVPPPAPPAKRVGEDLPPVPAGLATPEFLAAWEEWAEHRREIRHRLTPLAAKRQLVALEAVGPVRAVQAIHESVQQGWQGLFPERTLPPGVQRGRKPPTSPDGYTPPPEVTADIMAGIRETMRRSMAEGREKNLREEAEEGRSLEDGAAPADGVDSGK